MKKKLFIILSCILIFGILVACDSGKKEEGYAFTHLSPEEAAEFVENAEAEGVAIIDVRGDIEWEQGHIPGSQAIWFEDFEAGPVDQLPDKDQKILVYCQSGYLSKDVANLLVEQGYTQVYEFDGMDVWTGEVEVAEKYKDLV